jgi:phosphate transport system substrate-binding protein
LSRLPPVRFCAGRGYANANGRTAESAGGGGCYHLWKSKIMSKSSIGFIVITVGLLAGGWFWFEQSGKVQPSAPNVNSLAPTVTPAPTLTDNDTDISRTQTPTPNPERLPANSDFPPVDKVPSTIQVRIDGATSMVTINKNLKTAFEQKFSGTRVTTQSRGSEQGLRALQAGEIDLAAVSRALTPLEESQGLGSVTISADPIAIVVGINSLAPNNLTAEQVTGIFNGSISDWEQVGGKSGKIRIVNRHPASGTRQVFQDLVLKGVKFGTTPNFTTLSRDATTPLLQALATDGIGYATYYQVAAQKTVRVLSVAGVSPAQLGYPYPRSLLYVYKTPPSPTVKAFLGYVASPEGKQTVKSD